MSFKIDSIEIYHVGMPLITPFTTAYGSDETVHSVLVRMRSGDAFGWGETSPLQYPAYSPEYGAGVYRVIRDILAPAVVGQSFATAEDMLAKVSWIKGNYFAKGGLDMAWWDLAARIEGTPLWKMLGGVNPVVEVGADFGIQKSLDVLMKKIDEAMAEGYKRVKLKYARGWDVDMVATARKTFPDMVFHIDCNSSFTLADVPMFQKLDEYNLAMFEQPLMHDDLVDHAVLQKQIDTPICLDESITSPDRARKAVAIGACGWVNIKPARVGGNSNAVKINDICAEEGIPCWIGGMIESGVGAAHCLALGTLSNIKYPSDVFHPSRFYEKDLATPGLELSGPSEVTAGDAPGIGCVPDPEQLERFTVETATLRAK